MPDLNEPAPCVAPCDTILDLLTHKVRVISDRQLARTCYPNRQDPLSAARNTINLLSAKGLVTQLRTTLHPEIALIKPVSQWTKSDPLPHFGQAAWQLQSRWTLPPIRTVLTTATRKAKCQMAGTLGGRIPRASERLHDLMVTSLYLMFQRNFPQRAKAWVHEDTLICQGHFLAGERIPDAMTDGIAIDFGGRYPKSKLISFHNAMSQMGVSYEIW